MPLLPGFKAIIKTTEELKAMYPFGFISFFDRGVVSPWMEQP